MNFSWQHHRNRKISSLTTAYTTLLHVVLLPRTFVATAFNSLSPTNLRRLAEASSLSYLSFDRIPTSPYYPSCQLEPLLQVVDPASESGATIFLEKATPSSSTVLSSTSSARGQTIIVACRGSANPKNFGTNLKFKLVPATKLSQNPNNLPPDAAIHEGFQDASLGLWKVLCPQLINVLDDKNLVTSAESKEENLEVVFTGHSLGAATALLCSVHYNSYFRRKDSDGATTITKHDTIAKATIFSYSAPTIVTFGGPKLCNTILAQYLRTYALEGSQILHLVHDKDPILANNQKLWDSLGFENVGVEMECDPNQVALPHCGVDETEIKKKKRPFLGSVAWNIVDHCNYMGVFIGPRIFMS
mmetsp:Transcript_4282/g.8837  ORF Transcript_4282/g.8837 Transcript_4282/m.8837 type:complete len:359 (+) Transcript_4282:31-1107(+)